MRTPTLRRIALFLLFSILLPLISGCQNNSDGSGRTIRYDIPSGVSTLDPQLASSQTARMIIANTFEGLFRQLPNGEVEPALAESYSISSNQLTYTFKLRTDGQWVGWIDGKPAKVYGPVTAYDFVFALKRLFDKDAPSPFIGELLSIRNARDIRDGKMSNLALGVFADDPYTLRIELDQPDSLLPELLASSYAVPCNQTFFLETRARYGLELSGLLCNGPFYLRSWDNEEAISLRKNPSYREADTVAPSAVALYIPHIAANVKTENRDPVERFLSGSTDACKIDSESLPAVLQAGCETVSFEDTVWSLLLNNQLPQFAQADIRKAAAYSIDRSLFDEYLPGYLRATSVLVPPAVPLAGHSYRQYAGDSSPIVFSPDLAQRSFRAGLADLQVSSLQPVELLIYDDNTHALLAGTVQRNLQQSLSVPVNLVRLSREELSERVQSGNYQAAIFPLAASYSSPDAVFSYFKTDSSSNLANYSNETLDALLGSVSTVSSNDQFDVYRRAEQLLLADCAAIPLFFETSYYAMASGVSDIAFSPFLSGISFRDARRQ